MYTKLFGFLFCFFDVFIYLRRFESRLNSKSYAIETSMMCKTQFIVFSDEFLVEIATEQATLCVEQTTRDHKQRNTFEHNTIWFWAEHFYQCDGRYTYGRQSNREGYIRVTLFFLVCF